MTQTFPMASAGDPPDRLTELFDMHFGRLYKLARRLVNCRDDALDLVQETFLRAAHSPKSVPAGHREEEAWLVRVLVNIRRDQWRHAAVCARYARNEHVRGTEISSPGWDPEPAIAARTIIWKALDLLPPRRRAVIVMHELEGLDMSSIASLLGIGSITVRWHLSQGRRELARIIRPTGIDETGGIK